MPSERPVLGERRQAILHAILEYTTDHGYPPTVRELGTLVGLASSATVKWHLQCLMDDGFITMVPGQPRTLVVLPQ